MSILSIVVTGILIAWMLLRWVMRFNSSLRGGRGCLSLIILPVLLVVFAGVYISTEFIWNKGPNDWGAIFHAMSVVQQKNGRQGKISIEMKNDEFLKDANDPQLGTYRFHYHDGNQTGIVTFHYDKATGKFDRDEVVPDK